MRVSELRVWPPHAIRVGVMSGPQIAAQPLLFCLGSSPHWGRQMGQLAGRSPLPGGQPGRTNEAGAHRSVSSLGRIVDRGQRCLGVRDLGVLPARSQLRSQRSGVIASVARKGPNTLRSHRYVGISCLSGRWVGACASARRMRLKLFSRRTAVTKTNSN